MLKSPLHLFKYSIKNPKNHQANPHSPCSPAHTSQPSSPYRVARDPAPGFRQGRAWALGWVTRGPLPSATPHPQSCPPWRCHRGCSASCVVHTFCPNAEERKQGAGDVPSVSSGGQCTPASPQFQVSHGELEGTCAFQTPLYRKPSKGQKLN